MIPNKIHCVHFAFNGCLSKPQNVIYNNYISIDWNRIKTDNRNKTGKQQWKVRHFP